MSTAVGRGLGGTATPVSVAAEAAVMECEEAGCEARAAVRLHIPWDDNREVCAAHARGVARKDGVVAEPLEDAGGEWP